MWAVRPLLSESHAAPPIRRVTVGMMEASEPSVTPEALAAVPPLPVGPSTRRRLVAIAEVALCSSVPTQLAIGAALGAAGFAPLDATGKLSRDFVLLLSLADTAVLIFLMVWLLREHGERPKALWLGTRPWTREAGFGLLVVPALAVAVGLLLTTI